ncbi:organic cation transporter protein-like [Schistocerca gregaria]|uniref:organic cation transporter protein-like n=1 Tax=Schistocerca gregaria TaxID=7010 RepID=UPI00211E0E22|nr:organic cation transporter protein-like [Schistocerca gregaria]
MGQKREDQVQAAMGEWGRWQLLVVLSVSLVKIPVAWHQLGILFLAPPARFWCEEPPSNISGECSVSLNGTPTACTSYRYDRSLFTETIITQWDLVCDREQLANVAQTVFMFGILIGNVLFGMLADRFGRKKPLVFGVIMQLLTGTAVAFVPWYPVFLAVRFLLAIVTGGTMITSFVLCMEILGGKWRMIVSTLSHIPFSLGHMSMVGFAYFARDWHNFQLLISLPSVVLLFYWCVLPESPRWLLAVGRTKEAGAILEKAAAKNNLKNVDVSQIIKTTVSATEKKDVEEKGNILDLFRTPNMRMKTLCMYFNWFVCGLCFYGLAQYMGQVGGNIFINVTISGVIEMCGPFICIYCMGKFGRRNTLIGGHMLAAAACLLVMVVPRGDGVAEWPGILLAALGIIGMSTSFPTVYLYSGELFPTVVRNVGVGSSSMCARVGSMVAPFVSSLIHYSEYLPPLLFGATPLIGGLLCLLLPETANTELSDTLLEGENFGKKPKNKKQGSDNDGYVGDSAL